MFGSLVEKVNNCCQDKYNYFGFYETINLASFDVLSKRKFFVEKLMINFHGKQDLKTQIVTLNKIPITRPPSSGVGASGLFFVKIAKIVREFVKSMLFVIREK